MGAFRNPSNNSYAFESFLVPYPKGLEGWNICLIVCSDSKDLTCLFRSEKSFAALPVPVGATANHCQI